MMREKVKVFMSGSSSRPCESQVLTHLEARPLDKSSTQMFFAHLEGLEVEPLKIELYIEIF